jgi:peptide/nickel transport system permease protein
MTGRDEGWREFRRSGFGPVGLVLLGLFVVMALAEPLLLATIWPRKIYDPLLGYDAPTVELVVVDKVTDPDTQVGLSLAKTFDPMIKIGDTLTQHIQPAPPSWKHPLGTDALGRDVLSQLLAGAAPTLEVGIGAALATALIGTGIAVASAYYRGPIDTSFSTFSDSLLLLPAPILMIMIGFSDLGKHIGAVQFGLLYGVLAGASGAAIVLRTRALSVMASPFIDAARVAGAGPGRVIARHLIPNLAPLAAIYMLFGAAGAVVTDGFVAWLSLGKTRYNWGTMIYYAVTFTPTGDIPWNVLTSGALAISTFAGAFYLIALGIRHASNPRARTR